MAEIGVIPPAPQWYLDLPADDVPSAKAMAVSVQNIRRRLDMGADPAVLLDDALIVLGGALKLLQSEAG